MKAAHVTELRQAIATLRARFALPAAVWTDAALIPGVTPVTAAHMTELREALNGVYYAAGVAPPLDTDAPIVVKQSVMTVMQLARLRAAVVAIGEPRGRRTRPPTPRLRRRTLLLLTWQP